MITWDEAKAAGISWSVWDFESDVARAAYWAQDQNDPERESCDDILRRRLVGLERVHGG